MYTTDDRRDDYYEDDYYENNNWDNRKGLIFKIIIIILCIIVLIWLIKALKSNNNLVDNGEVHTANTEKIRLAAEEYFFIKNNKNKTSYISLAGLKNEGLITDIVDANNKVCNDSGTNVNLKKENGVYKMIIKFSCSTKDQDETFLYHQNTLACLNCKGKTKMTGKKIVDEKTDKKEEKEEIVNVDTNTRDDNDEYRYYSCVDWTDWSKNRLYNRELTERIKTLVTGVKYGKSTTYGNWSEYTTTPISNSDGIEVDTKVVTESVWSSNKTGTDIDTNSKNIKIISTEEVANDITCKDGFVEDNVCYSNRVYTGNLTFKEYFSGDYKVLNPYCESVQTLLNNEGLYVFTYVNCQYNKVIEKNETNSKHTVYTYQELSTSDVTYYRYRTVQTVTEPVEYTSKKYEENNLPNGFVKLAGSEETYYSYKLTNCVK